ncbi:zinc-dependent metalloprotease [Lewinella sp. IMCC34183]|uniref:zinc-dependent metalloprotease n=1 Tax=Lewinella sp. IMCC34183 TaxID=2248762 RepID=UPI001E631BF9|nr:zinc-dependent metalloprotease [Lewinella sp. IMCC34183]
MRYLYLCLLACMACQTTRPGQAAAPPAPAPDTTAVAAAETDPAPAKAGKFKPYEKVITSAAVSDTGLFTVHRVDGKYFYEVPFERLGQDMLLVSRIAKIPSDLGGGYLNAGSKANEQLVQWSRVNDALHLTSVSYESVADDALPISQSVRDNNYAPVIMAFPIQAFSPDSTAAVIQVDELFSTDVPAISGLNQRLRKSYGVRNLDKDRSFISRMAAYPENVEVRHDMTYVASDPPSNSSTGTISMQLSQSMYLLPTTPMMPRLYDQRVGWFTVSQIDYGSDALKADQKRYIKRWKLVPKDKEAYARGELVEPEQPIVYYLDPATPEKFRPYFIQGIEDWQEAFETAGFKNAIVARLPPSPEEDPDWSPEDSRYSVVRYVASTTRNAVGPSVSDPRSGQIIESDIIWYHNHLRSYRNRYLLETGAANPTARTLDTPDEEIGEMMRRVISHEVGHALGLPHNMKASYAYPTDSLRSATFTNKWGLASTIMDYTRYNYVAQPGDEGVRWVRMLGPYDSYAINYGYRYLPGMQTPAEEKETLNEWIAEKQGDPVYLFGGRSNSDPSAQTESVGDDPVKATRYGMKNLHIVADQLADWVNQPGEDYTDLDELYGELLGVWSRYAAHVTANVGGVYEQLRTTDEEGTTYTPVAREKQREAVTFLNEEVFTTLDWLMPEEIITNIGASGIITRMRNLQARQLNNLLDADRLERMIENEALNGSAAYSAADMLRDLRNGLWSEAGRGRDIDVYRRNLQRAHVERLTELLEEDADSPSDVSALVRAELNAIAKLTESAARGYRDGIVKYHLAEVSAEIEETLSAK